MVGMKQYRPWEKDQSLLFPPSPRDWLPEGHLVYFVLDIVETMDLSAITREIQAKDPRGERPFSPHMMVSLLLYAYCAGVYSSRRIAKATYDDVAFRVIAAGEHPHFTRINAFRLQHLGALKGLFLQVLMLCRQAGLVRLGHVALDGAQARLEITLLQAFEENDRVEFLVTHSQKKANQQEKNSCGREDADGDCRSLRAKEETDTKQKRASDEVEGCCDGTANP